MNQLTAALERLEQRYANAYEDYALRHGTDLRAACVLCAKRDLCRELRVELQADAKETT